MDLKSCVRTQIKNTQLDLVPLERWSTQFNLFFDVHSSGFVYIAADKNLLNQVRTIDHSFEPHEKKLGVLLGYPICCCEKIAQVKENNIDDFEQWLVTQAFRGHFHLINPSAYFQGKAFISHVPCSTTCNKSLKIAQKFVQFLLAYKYEKVFQPWIEQLKKLSKEAIILELDEKVLKE